jgi:hypothetical protein
MNFAGRQPRTLAQPLMGIRIFQRALGGKQPLRNARAYSFVHRAAPQRHGHRRSFISAGIEILAIDQNHNGNETCFAVGHLDQAQRTRSLVGLGATRSLSRRDSGNHQSQTGRDDEPPSPAV